MKKLLFFLTFLLSVSSASAQVTLSLDSLRKRALANNKTLAIAREHVSKADYTQKAAHTNFFPRIALTAGYVHTGKSVSILSDEQKTTLPQLGTGVATSIAPYAQQIIQQRPDLAPLLAPMLGEMTGSLNAAGQSVVDAFNTNTRNIFAGAVTLTQPLYMGGKIRAYDRITNYARQIAGKQLETEEQEVLLSVDQAYWQVVSLAGKRKLAVQYRDMLSKINADMEKMIAEGVATKSNGLAAGVKLGEAEMTLLKVDDGLQLSRMALCQLCGLPFESQFVLTDELREILPTEEESLTADAHTALTRRPELESLRLLARIGDEKVKIERSAFLPQLAFMGSYGMMTPSVYNGFETKLRGTWNVGITLAVPVWNWGEGRYKVKAAKADAAVAKLKLEDAGEKITLQVQQANLQVSEAKRRLALSRKNAALAEENRRTAEVGFREGVIPASEMLAAQTAWAAAQDAKLDAEIDVKLTEAYLKKALGY